MPDPALNIPYTTGTFNELFSLYRTPLLGYAFSYLKSREDAEDVVQDVFVRIWDMIERVELEGNLKSLLFISTRNQCISVLRSRIFRDSKDSRRQDSGTLQAKIDLIALEYSTLEAIEFEELHQQIMNILDDLPEDQRQFFLQNRLEGMQYSDIARNSGISIKTVEKKMSAALRVFRHKLKDYQFLAYFWL